MTIIDHALADAQANNATDPCPAWCRSDTADPDGGASIHRRAVGSLGVAIEWCRVDRLAPGPVIYVPELDVDPCNTTPGFARQLAADLIAAADVLDGATA